MKNCGDSAFSLCGLQWGCRPFSCPCSQNVRTCLSKESIPAIPSWNSKHPIPTRSLRFLRATVPCTSSALWLHPAHPFVAAAEKEPAMWLKQTKLLASLRWKRWCQPFSCRSSQKLTHCRKVICLTCLSKESMPLFNLFWNKKPALPTRSLSSRERQHVPPALHFVVVASCPSLYCSWEKKKKIEKACLMQRSRGFGHWVMASKICCNAVIVLSVVLCDCCKPMNSCRDWAFSLCWLEVGLPAFRLPMFATCNALPKRDLSDMFV